MSLFVDITKKFGDFTLDVSFATQDGVLGILGASGCGKSVTLMCISGVMKPDRGKIILNERVLFDSEKKINLPPQERKVGYLFQNYALFPNMTVKQNILCGLYKEKQERKNKRSGIQTRVMDKKREQEALEDMITLLQLEGLEKHRPAQLSGGQQQRVALARILVGNPELLILDEPFSALDSHLRGQLQIEMKEILKKFGKDTLLVTHSRDEAYHLCQEIALLDAGRLLIQKETKDLFINPESRQGAVLTGCKNVANAIKVGAYEVHIPAWGINLTTSLPVPDDLLAIGIRAHYFHSKTLQNRFPVRFTGEMEGPFEYILQFCYPMQEETAPAIWWRISKEKRGSQLPTELGISPANILLLNK